jgi:hypothetical protein
MPSDTPSNITIGTTNIGLNNIKNAFKGTTTRLSDYYRGGTNIYNTTRLSTIPISGPISFGNFKNTTNVITGTVTFTSPPFSWAFTSPSTFGYYINVSSYNIIKIKAIPNITFTFNSTQASTTVTNQMTKFAPYIGSTALTTTTNTFIDNFAIQQYKWVFYNATNTPIPLSTTGENAISIKASAGYYIPIHSSAIIKITIEYIN